VSLAFAVSTAAIKGVAACQGSLVAGAGLRVGLWRGLCRSSRLGDWSSSNNGGKSREKDGVELHSDFEEVMLHGLVSTCDTDTTRLVRARPSALTW
jgi:hypothetical protein